jgi:hypothetical protein
MVEMVNKITCITMRNGNDKPGYFALSGTSRTLDYRDGLPTDTGGGIGLRRRLGDRANLF